MTQLNICREIATDEEFISLREEWNALLNECSYPTPFCSWEWAWEWWNHFCKGDPSGYRLLVAQAHNSEGRLIGLAPFVFPGTLAGPLRLRPLRPLATRMRCMVDDLTEEPVILLRRGMTEEALQGLWAALSAWKGCGHWDLVHLRLMRHVSEPDIGSLWRQMPRTRLFVLTRASQRIGQTRSLPRSWPEFRKSLGKSMRDNVAYYPRLLTRDGHSWSVRIVRAPEEMALAASFLIGLHGDRARSQHGPSHLNHLPGPNQKQFLQDVLVRLSYQDMAAIALLEIDGVPIAAQSVLETGGRMTFYYSGFDTHWHRYSPVTVLHIALLQDAILRGMTEIDYLPGAEPWKTRWNMEPEYVYDELSCLSINPRALFRSVWRKVIFWRSQRRGSYCACGYCSPVEQIDGRPAAQISIAAGK
ncbi:MAG: GNAT family N-acetyltransferase [Janthinobacterium lividum]